MALLFISCGTLLFILQVSHSLIHHVTLLLVGHTALLLTLGVKHCPALGLSELIALLLVPNVLPCVISLRALNLVNCEAFFIHGEADFGYKQSFFGLSTLIVWPCWSIWSWVLWLHLL